MQYHRKQVCTWTVHLSTLLSSLPTLGLPMLLVLCSLLFPSLLFPPLVQQSFLFPAQRNKCSRDVHNRWNVHVDMFIPPIPVASTHYLFVILKYLSHVVFHTIRRADPRPHSPRIICYQYLLTLPLTMIPLL